MLLGCPKPADYKAVYESSNNPVTINCYVDTVSNYSMELSTKLFGNVKSMNFDMRATCPCGKYEGNHFVGLECDICGYKVSPVYCKDIEYKGWIVFPMMFPKLIHPLFFEMVTKLLNHLPTEMRRYDGRTLTIADWLLNPALPIQRFWPEMGNGLTYLSKNWEKVIAFLLTIQPKKKRETILPSLRLLLDEYKDIILVDRYPVINEFLHLMTQYNENSTRFQIDDSSPHLYEIYSSLCSIVEDDNMGKKLTTKLIDRRYMKIQMKLVEYAKSLIVDKVATKGGLIRKSVISGRLHFTGRAVIAPLTDANMGDELHVPWEIMCVVFRSDIVNKLRNKYHMLPNDALRKAIESVYHPYDPIVNEIFEEMMAEHKRIYGFKGIPVLPNRNPSVHLGACWLGFVTKITKDKTIYVSVLNIYAMNADFDGDQLNLLFPREPERLRYFANLHPAMLVQSKSAPEISNYVRIPATAVNQGSTWLLEGGPNDGGGDTPNHDIQIFTESGYVFRERGIEHDCGGTQSILGKDGRRALFCAVSNS